MIDRGHRNEASCDVADANSSSFALFCKSLTVEINVKRKHPERVGCWRHHQRLIVQNHQTIKSPEHISGYGAFRPGTLRRCFGARGGVFVGVSHCFSGRCSRIFQLISHDICVK